MSDNGTETDFSTWLSVGIEHGWVSPPYCATHDGPPLTADERDLDEDDFYDFCVHAVRLL